MGGDCKRVNRLQVASYSRTDVKLQNAKMGWQMCLGGHLYTWHTTKVTSMCGKHYCISIKACMPR